jgi:putative hydrolase of the HAD superfamily
VAESGQVPAVRAVIFDWGGVITSPIADTVQAWLVADQIDRDSYAAAMRPWVRQAYGPEESDSPIHALERGEVADAEFEQSLASLLTRQDGSAVAAAGLLKRMFAASAVQAAMLDLIRELRADGLRVTLLSNSWGDPASYPADLLAELFDDVVISAQVGMRKPEERIFRLALDRLGLQAAQCAFVDDMEGNIVAARALGLAAVHHSDPADTRARLAAILTGTAERQ